MRRPMPLPGQIPMWFTDSPEPAHLGEIPARPAISGRAGTPLRHEHTTEIVGRGRRGKLVHGLFDASQRLYQSGGELSSFVFWKRHLVTLSLDAWEQIKDRAEFIEMIDHEHNECWRIQVKKAAKHGLVYNAGIGDRLGVPLDLFDVIDGSGNYRKRGLVG